MKNILNQMEQIQELINNSDYILIGAGAGLSTSAGIEYAGKRFEENFADFIKKYHFTDMYTSSFYDFETLMTNFIKLDLIKKKYLLHKEVIDIFNVV